MTPASQPSFQNGLAGNGTPVLLSAPLSSTPMADLLEPTPVNKPRIAALGWDETWIQHFTTFQEQGLLPGRVAVEDRGRYTLFAEDGELNAHVAGRFTGTAGAPADFPKVGDWVAFARVAHEAKAVIRAILPRRSKLARKMVGREVEEQVLVANVDTAFIVQALDASFNPRLLERYLAMVREAGVQPVILLNKTDLHDHVPERHAEAARLAAGDPVVDVSARTGLGLGHLRRMIRTGTTAVFVGTSGVGKSSLINRLFGEHIQATTEVREQDAKGRHTTSWRELIVLPDGGLVIDTPGMREFHLWMAGDHVHQAFPEIEEVALRCRFSNCSHREEKGCAVREAVAAGTLAQERVQQFLKLQRELLFLEKARREASEARRPGAKDPRRGRFRTERARRVRPWESGEDEP
jgi:ribosome biogenesis GTPase